MSYGRTSWISMRDRVTATSRLICFYFETWNLTGLLWMTASLLWSWSVWHASPFLPGQPVRATDVLAYRFRQSSLITAQVSTACGLQRVTCSIRRQHEVERLLGSGCRWRCLYTLSLSAFSHILDFFSIMESISIFRLPNFKTYLLPASNRL
jgi:hypothetical protein